MQARASASTRASEGKTIDAGAGPAALTLLRGEIVRSWHMDRRKGERERGPDHGGGDGRAGDEPSHLADLACA